MDPVTLALIAGVVLLAGQRKPTGGKLTPADVARIRRELFKKSGVKAAPDDAKVGGKPGYGGRGLKTISQMDDAEAAAAAQRKADDDAAKAKAGVFTFPPLGWWDSTELFCSPNDPYGGWRDSSKLKVAREDYVFYWGFSPTREFENAIKQRSPCNHWHIDEIVKAFPPFPGQTFTKEELVKIQARQRAERKLLQKQEAESSAECRKRLGESLIVSHEIFGTIVGAYYGGPAGAKAGFVAGEKIGTGEYELLGSFCE